MAITVDQVLAMDYPSIVAAIKAPETSKEMQALLRERKVAVHISTLMQQRNVELEGKEAELAATAKTIPPTTDELAAEAATVAAQPDASVPAPANVPAGPDFTADDAAWKAEGVTVQRDGTGKITRLVQEYQVRDAEGAPIGRPTHLEATTPQGLIAKQRTAHEEATRAYSRLRKQKLSFKEQEAKRILTPEEIKAAATKALEAKDVAEAETLVRGVIESNYDKREKEIEQKRYEQEGFATANQFLRKHLHDYYPVDANNKALGEYLQEHGMDYTLDNLEFAFTDLMSQNQLVKVPKPNLPEPTVVAEPIAQQPTPEANAAPSSTPAPAAPAPAAASAQPPAAATPAVEATATTSAAPTNSAPAARRPGVNGSLPPGTMSAHRPEVVDPAQARKEFMKTIRDMDPKILAGKVNPQSPKYDGELVKRLNSYGIRIK